MASSETHTSDPAIPTGAPIPEADGHPVNVAAPALKIEAPLVSAPLRGSRSYRVVHLSDIHFKAGFSLSQWKYLTDYMKETIRPDAVIVTGDFVENPWPHMLALARREMMHLEELLKTPVICIPGNHDVAFQGSVPFWPFTQLYGAIFSDAARATVQSYPSFRQYAGYGRFRRAACSLGLSVALLARYLTGNLGKAPAPGDLVLPTSVPFRIAGFNSNASLLLASGRVSADQLNSFGEFATKLGRSVADALKPRIALIHHHVLPIPYTRAQISGVESMLVLRNAGTVLRELWNHDFDLVLHGHRHYSNAAKINFLQGDDDGVGGELTVLSIASPTAREPEARSNAFYSIEFRRNGITEVQEFRLGAEASITAQPKFLAHSKSAVKARQYKRLLGVMHHSADELVREVNINSAGTSFERNVLIDFGPRAGEVSRVPLRLAVDRGPLNKEAIQKCADPWPSNCHLRHLDSENDRIALAEVSFNPPLGVGETATFGTEYETANSFAMSRWELQTFPRPRDSDLPEDMEAFSFRVKYPLRKLRLVLSLPNSLADPRPQLVCYAPSNYPQLSLDDNDDVAPPTGEGPLWTTDAEMSAQEARSMQQPSDSRWECSIEHPIVGYRYEMRWNVEDVRERVIDEVNGRETKLYRRLLMKYSEGAYGSAKRNPELTASVRRLLNELLDAVYPLVRATVGSEVFRVTLFTFDEQKGDLVAVEEVIRGDGQTIMDTQESAYRIPFGVGVAGLTFKRCETFGYVMPLIRKPGVTEILFQAAHARNLKAILGVPLFHPNAWTFAQRKTEAGEEVTWDDMPSVHQEIGVVSFASDSDASGLSALDRTEEAVQLTEVIEYELGQRTRSLLEMLDGRS